MNHPSTPSGEPDPSAATIGVIGIGAMGLAMAKNLQRRGYRLAVRDICTQAEQQAHAFGMNVCLSPAALMKQTDMAIVVVVNASQIEEVLFGEDGVASVPAHGKTVMLCSTIGPTDTQRFAGQLAQYGIETIDAPISGGPARAETGTMSMMLAARDEVLARWNALLAVLSDKQFRISDTIGDGAKTKLVNNLLAGINLIAGAEALALGIKLGLDPHKLFDVISASSGASWVFTDRMARALQDDFAPRAQTLILNKDVGLATAMADAAGHDTPLGDAALAKFGETIELGWGALDDAAVLKTYLERGAR